MKHYRLFAVLLMFIVVATMAAPSVTQAAPRLQTFSASLTPVGGLVQYLPSGKTDWQTVNQVTLINEGDQVRTGAGGTAKLNVVTGTQVDILPSSIVALNKLSMGDSSGMTFNLLQLQGISTMTVSQTLKAGDNISVSSPSFTANIRGTTFQTLITSSGDGLMITKEGTVEMINSKGKKITVGPGDCGAGFEGADVLSCKDAQNDLKKILKTLAQDNPDSDLVRTFIANVLGISPVPDNLGGLISAIEGATITLDNIASAFDTMISGIEADAANNPLAPETCGNHTQDDGETTANCPQDFADPALIGNGICDVGEDIISAEEDCAPNANLLKSAALNEASSGGIEIGGTDGGPAIVGNTPGGITPLNSGASGTGVGVCTVTTTADVNLRSTSTGAVVGVAGNGTTFTIIGSNNNGWVVQGGSVSVSAAFTTAPAGCQ
jgi:hypothetical protein